VNAAAVILHYHRIAEPPTDVNRLCVSPEVFEEQLDAISQSWDLVPLACLAEPGSLAGRRRPAVITFDDGYVDNLHIARPLLEHFSAPATVFVATAYMGCEEGFWWDRLERLVMGAAEIPVVLHVTVGGGSRQISTGVQLRRAWAALRGRNPDRRAQLYFRLRSLLLAASHHEREDALAELSHQLAAGPPSRSADRIMSAAELRDLVRGGLVTVGAHTATHPVLSTLPAEEQYAEIIRSRRELEAVVGSRVDQFAYPYGVPASFTSATTSAVLRSGFVLACTTVQGAAGPAADLLRLPRLTASRWTGRELVRRMERLTR
jgi:peptidoglycan/xylan/chitin deacetylase (PgdA/CDA1 family)